MGVRMRRIVLTLHDRSALIAHLGGPDSALLQQDLRVPWVKASRLYQAS